MVLDLWPKLRIGLITYIADDQQLISRKGFRIFPEMNHFTITAETLMNL